VKKMIKTIQRPLACRNAHCGAMCSPADAEFFRSNPSKCYNYERRDDLYMVKSIPLDKVKQAREEIKQLPITDTAIKLVIEILDKLIESEET
jgi:hypothetical protein